jgi:hypothetical protein
MEVQELLDKIKFFDCQPSVYNVSIQAADHFSGYRAYLSFRSTDPLAVNGIDAHGDTPELALNKLLNDLNKRFGKCPHCGEYRHITNA